MDDVETPEPEKQEPDWAETEQLIHRLYLAILEAASPIVDEVNAKHPDHKGAALLVHTLAIMLPHVIIEKFAPDFHASAMDSVVNIINSVLSPSGATRSLIVEQIDIKPTHQGSVSVH